MNGPSSPTSPNRFSAWLLLLVTLVAPSAVGITFVQNVIRYPWQALGFLLLYEFLVIVITLVTGVWQQLQNDWVKRIVDWINSRTQGLFYEKYYHQSLIYAHRNFDMTGLKTQADRGLDLENVFVELRMALTPPHQTTSDPLQIPKIPETGQYSIWHYLTSQQFVNEPLAIIGAPGSGKTTLLQHVTLTLVDRKKRHRIKVPYKLPFFLFLRDYGETLKENKEFSLVDAVQTQVSKWASPVPPKWVERQLVKGQCLILLDGLDEVADLETRRQMANWVQQQMVVYRNNRFIITSRPFGYRSNPLEGVTVLEVMPFAHNQIIKFIDNWYLATEVRSEGRNDPGVRMKAKEGAENLLRRLLSKPVLFNLAVNPLLLTMIATVHRYRATLPDKRVALYEEICEVFLGKRQEARGLRSELNPTQKQLVLQPLAYHMMQSGVREITLAEAQSVIEKPLARVNLQMTTEEFLRMVENSSSLLLEREIGIYGFAHLTFQEYLAAMYVRENKLENVLVTQVESSWWHETILLYCARADATPIIIECLSRKPLSVEALKLAIDCREEARDIRPDVRAQLEVIISQYAEDVDPERRRVVAKALLTRRLHEMVLLNEETYIDRSLISCTEYQLFLDEKREQGYSHQPDHWTDDRFVAGQGQKSVLGIRPSDAIVFCTWLTEQNAGAWRYRLPASDELENLEIEEGNARGNDRLETTGFWIDEGEDFAWVRGRLPIIKNITEEQLNSSSGHDDNRIEMHYQSLNLDDPRHQLLREHIIFARRLAYARDLNVNLTQALTSIRERVQAHENALQAEYRRARIHRSDLRTRLDSFRKNRQEGQTKFNRAQQQESNLQMQLDGARAHQAALKDQLDNIRKNEHNAQTEFKLARKRERSLEVEASLAQQDLSLQTQLSSVRARKSELNNQLESVREDEHNLQTELNLAEKRESSLQAELNTAHEQRTNLQVQLDNIDRTGQENSLQNQLDLAQEHENNLQAQFNSFMTGARTFYSICSRFLTFTPTYNKDNPLSSALADNDALNLDRVIININNGAFEKVLLQFGDLISAFAKSLSLDLDRYRSNVHINIDDQDKTDIAYARSLASQIALIPFNDYIQKLANIFKVYLNVLTENRPMGGKGRSSLRLYIRYFARELVQNLSYWSWKELLSLSTQPSTLTNSINEHLIDTYLNAYVTFTLLEERIQGRLPAREGILIVKEREREPMLDVP